MRPTHLTGAAAVSHSLLVAAILLGPSAVNATVGGPRELEVIGGDRATSRVYFTLTDKGENDWVPRVFFIRLDTKTEEAQPVPAWPDSEGSLEAPEVNVRIEKLKRTLDWLPPAYYRSLALNVRNVGKGTELGQGKLEGAIHQAVDIHLVAGTGSFVGRTEMDTFTTGPGLRVEEVLSTMDPNVVLAVVGYPGIVAHEVHEVQALVVLHRQGHSKNRGSTNR